MQPTDRWVNWLIAVGLTIFISVAWLLGQANGTEHAIAATQKDVVQYQREINDRDATILKQAEWIRQERLALQSLAQDGETVLDCVLVGDSQP